MATQLHLPPRRPLMVLTAGDPAAEKSVLVHRCVPFGGTKPEKCLCIERICLDDARALIREDKACWLTATRSNGSKYTFRNSIVMRTTAAQVEEVVPDRHEQQDRERCAAAARREQAKKKKRIGEAIQSFRNHLTPQQNRKYSDLRILNALRYMESSDFYLEGVEAEQNMWAATNGKTGQDLLDAVGQDEYLRWSQAIKLKNALITVSKRYFNLILAWAGLGMNSGKYMSEAECGKGALVYGGDDRDIAAIAVHEEANERGTHRGTAEGFVGGTGGLQVGVEGGEVVDGQCNLDSGTHPDLEDDPNDGQLGSNGVRE